MGRSPAGDFRQAAACQWINRKARAMALTAIAAYAPDRSLAAVIAMALVFGAVNLPSLALWAAAGQSLRHLLVDPGRLRLFNVTMAVLLLALVLPML